MGGALIYYEKKKDSRFSHVGALSESRYGGYKYPRSGSSTPEPFQCPDHLAYRDAWGGDTLLNAPDPRVSGLKVYDKIYLLEGNGETSGTYIERAYHHDYKGRVIQTVEKNHLGGTSRVSLEYDFTGNILTRHESQQKSAGAPADVLVKNCTYDSRGRLLSDSTRLNDTGTWAVVTYGYDELGRLVGKTYGSGANAVSETLEYNIQGWLTGQSNPRFSMKLRYFDATKAPAASYTGNIVEWEWQHGTGSPDMYAFTYDALSRLTGTEHYRLSGTTWNVASNKFTEQGISYDRHGNIQTLKRYTYGALTDNTYQYVGNQLVQVNRIALFEYDANGNLQKDLQQDIQIGYNCLNLVSKVSDLSGNTKVFYTYSADGVKLRVKDAAGQVGFEYVGSLIYKRNEGALELESAGSGGGRITRTSSGYRADYFLTDHLGSVRRIISQFAATGTMVLGDQNDYLPYGLRWSHSALPAAVGRYQFSGKELQTVGFANNDKVKWFDFGARMYNGEIPRWFCVDPMADKYYGISPYAYCANNPVKFIDPDGKKLKIANNAARAMENVAKIAATSFGNQILDRLIGLNNTYTLNSTFLSKSSMYDYKSRDIYYVKNPWYSEVPGDGGSLSSLTAMSHETFHAFDHSFNTGRAFTSDEKLAASASMLEGRAVSFTNYIRSAYDLTPYRERYKNYKEDFFQFSSNLSESITNFTSLGGNKEETSYGFSYTKTIIHSEMRLGISFGKKKIVSQNNYYMVVSMDKDKNVTYKIFNDEDEFRKATASW